MTLITITALDSGPTATRQGDLIIPGTEVAFGGFSTLIGFKSTDSVTNSAPSDRDVYLIGMTNGGLQLARVGINDMTKYGKYTFYDPEKRRFSTSSPDPDLKDAKKVYLPGTFSSGSIFYSPYFSTFVMIYFNKMVDSTFYMRYLDLSRTVGADAIWVAGGKNGKGVVPEDAEALVRYAWSPEHKLWVSPTSKGGFNYAGVAHPEFFNRQYFAPSIYFNGTPKKRRFNDWYGSSLVSDKGPDSDGKHILLSWTGQIRGGMNNGIYQIQLAMLEFDEIPPNSTATASSSSVAATATRSSSASSVTANSQGTLLSFFLDHSMHKSKVSWALYGWKASLIGIVGLGILGL